MRYVPGTVMIGRVPFDNSSGAKGRPVVIVGNPAYWGKDASALVCAVTSVGPRSGDVPIDWQAAGLLQPSYVRPRPRILARADLEWRVGALTADDLEALNDALRMVLGL